MTKSAMFKKYIVCEECIDGKWGFYSIRMNTDCSPSRFIIVASFDTYEEANEYIDYLLHPEDYFNHDDD